MKNSAKRQSARHKKMDEKQQSDKRKKRISQRRKSNLEKREVGRGGNDDIGEGDDDDDDDDDEEDTANLNRVLVERMLLKNSGFNQGSRSVGGTPICLRRRKHDVNKNLSPMRSNDERSVARITGLDSEDIVKRRSNSVNMRNAITSLLFLTVFIISL